MEQLWAPWRLAYAAEPAKPKTGEPKDDCFLCRAVASAEDRSNLLVHRTALSCVVLNRFPYNNGHLLVSPLAHKAGLEEMTAEELLDQQETIRQFIAILRKRINPDGFNVGLNLGRVAGAGLPGHLHWHIVPRWSGDTNFMPVISDVKVIVQSLDSLYDMLVHELQTHAKN